jgi:phage terminase large subunit-like protein
VLQVGRGNGKTTLMAGLCLYDLCSAPGRRVHVIANREDQAAILLDTAKTMLRGIDGETDATVRQYSVARLEADCVMTALPAKESSLDGLTPSLWIADEAAEYRGRFLTKLTSSMAKRRESLGVIISTPADNPDNIYGEKVAHAEAILKGEAEDDSTIAMLYGIDPDDQTDDEHVWVKANPGIEHGQPHVSSLRRTWLSSKASSMGRLEFARYHCCRMVDASDGWLDMGLYPRPSEIEWADLAGRQAWAGVDLSKSGDLSAVVVAVPMDDGKVFLRGWYWWPDAEVKQRELDYRLPVRSWALRGKLELVPGRQVDYNRILATLKEIAGHVDLREVAYDQWGSKMFAEMAVGEGIPLRLYSQGISTMGPGCQLWMNHWLGEKIAIGDDPVFRNACRMAVAIRDSNGNVKVDKRKRQQVIDPLVAAIMAIHCWGGETPSGYANL